MVLALLGDLDARIPREAAEPNGAIADELGDTKHTTGHSCPWAAQGPAWGGRIEEEGHEEDSGNGPVPIPMVDLVHVNDGGCEADNPVHVRDAEEEQDAEGSGTDEEAPPHWAGEDPDGRELGHGSGVLLR